MSVPFYVSPEQLMKDRADYARKGIARGRPVVVLTCADGILFVTENPSKALHKISEIYDRIAFAAVGKYNEFENLRVAGVRYADLRGYSYDRTDVTARGLANAYAQTLGAVFTQESKPYEVEIVVAEVADTQDGDQLYRLTYDGSVGDEHGHVAMGASAEQISEYLDATWREGLPLAEALRTAVSALRGNGQPASSGGNGATAGADPGGGERRELTAGSLEAALLDRTVPRRAFRRLLAAEIEPVVT
jgi:proteasome alpha subunit